jgi:hypothetical protein
MRKISVQIVLLLSVAALLATGFSFDLFLLGRSASLIQVYDSVPDEILFFFRADKLSDAMLNFDLSGIRHFGVPYGYGFPFWLIAASSLLIRKRVAPPS